MLQSDVSMTEEVNTVYLVHRSLTPTRGHLHLAGGRGASQYRALKCHVDRQQALQRWRLRAEGARDGDVHLGRGEDEPAGHRPGSAPVTTGATQERASRLFIPAFLVLMSRLPSIRAVEHVESNTSKQHSCATHPLSSSGSDASELQL